jgi:hypothetical protein
MAVQNQTWQQKQSGKWVWLEEYERCGCSNVTNTKAEALGYCPRHGTDRRRITKLPNDPSDPITLGLS